MHVNIFQISAEGELPGGNFFANLIQMRTDVIAIIRADDSSMRQHRSVRHGAANVDGIKPLVEADGFSERFDSRISRLIESSAPCFRHTDSSLEDWWTAGRVQLLSEGRRLRWIPRQSGAHHLMHTTVAYSGRLPCSTITVVRIPPRGVNAASIFIQRGLVTATRSSRIMFVTRS